VSLKSRFLLYLAVVHLPFAALAVWLLGDHRPWLIVVELAFALSLTTGLWLVRSLFGPLELLKGGADLLKEADFSSRFRASGPAEMEELVSVYNAMLQRLQDERLRLTEQHLFLEKVLEASPAGVVTLDYDGRVDSVNPAAEALLERPAASLKGQPVASAGGVLGQLLDTLSPGEAKVVPVHGSRRVRVQRSEFLDHGFPRGLLVLTELTEELRQSEKAAYEKLIRMMSHEVNNSVAAVGSLLTSCLTYGEHLGEEDRADFTNALTVAVSRTSQLNAFMRSLADVVKIPPPRRSPADVEALARDAVALVSAEARKRDVTLTLERGEPMEPVPLDRAQMEQALVNVLVNALEAAGAGGRVTVRTAPGRLVVEDSGPGVPPEAAEHLFTPFFTTKPNGQGIGLTVVTEVLSQHGFRFALESAPGGPTRFVVDFPGNREGRPSSESDERGR